jgi:hypothetical protein
MLNGKSGGRKWKSAAARRLLALAPADTIPDAVHVVVSRLLEGVHCPPTNLEELGLRLNVRRIRYENLPVAGALVRVDDGFEILCSSAAANGRQQFTIAHEIAHAIFESTGPRCPQAGGELERLCDIRNGNPDATVAVPEDVRPGGYYFKSVRPGPVLRDLAVRDRHTLRGIARNLRI